MSGSRNTFGHPRLAEQHLEKEKKKDSGVGKEKQGTQCNLTLGLQSMYITFQP